MNQLIVCCLLFIVPIDFAAFYGSDYQDAIGYVKNHQKMVWDVAAQSEIAPERLVSVLFPELIRYSILKDFFETQALELLYIQQGSQVADFSIGRFQMKPSFAEAVEREIAEDEYLHIYFEELILIGYKSEESARKLRLERLALPHWQLKYAAALIKIVERKFPALSEKSLPEQIQFLATAYNHGFKESEAEIEAWISKQYFPYGLHYPGPQHAYAEIASDFFEKYATSLMTP